MSGIGWLVALAILSGVLYMNYSVFRIIAVSIICLILVGFIFKKSRLNKIELNNNLLILIYLFLISLVLSALFNSDLKLLVGGLVLIIILSALLFIYPSLEEDKSNEYIYKSIIITHAPLIVLSLIQGGDVSSFSGIFNNPNSFGIVCATLLVAFVSKCLGVVNKNIFDEYKLNVVTLLFYTSLIIGLLILLMYSNSRTSFIGSLIIILFSVTLVAIKLIYNKRLDEIKIFLKYGFITLAFTVFFIILFPIKELLERTILQKFQLKSNDTLSHRGSIWNITLKDSSLFGQGRDYFSLLEYGAHNTFISLLGQYGIIALLLFIIILSYLFMKSLKYAMISKNDHLNFLPLLLLLLFSILSMGEGLLFKGPMIAAFASLGSVVIFKQSYGHIKEYKL